MSLVAAIGYAIGIMIFAIVFRFRRRNMIDKHIKKAETKISTAEKGAPND